MDKPDLSGRTALVTGGGRGIGRATALALATAGACVVLAARTPAEIDAVSAEIEKTGGTAHPIACNVAASDEVERLFGQCAHVDIVVNNAGTIQPISKVQDISPGDWEQSINVNLNAVFYTCRRALPHMLRSDWGRIINISSGAARGGVSSWAPYSAAKAAVESFTKVVAAEVQGTGLRVNAVRPGIVDTEMQAEIRAAPEERFGNENSSRFRGYKERGQLRDPADPARLILWLLSDGAAGINGEVLSIDDPEVAEKIGLEPMGR